MTQTEFKNQKGKKGRGLTFSRRVAHAARALAYSPMFVIERRSLLGKSHPKSDKAAQVMNDICNATNGYGLEFFSKLVSKSVRKQTNAFDITRKELEHDAHLSNLDRMEIVNMLRIDGFAKVPNFMPAQQARDIYKQILDNPGKDRRGVNYRTQIEWLEDFESPRIDADRTALGQIIENSEIDFASLNLIARDFLNCRPILLGPNSWTTKKTKELDLETLDENAMAFHSDSDYFGFVKAFLLLTEVDMNSGPFTFVAKSHTSERQVQGRLKDSELGFEPSDLRFGTGNPGDLVLAVTTGWHKASIPRSGHRMMVQWLLTNSLFGSATQ